MPPQAGALCVCAPHDWPADRLRSCQSPKRLGGHDMAAHARRDWLSLGASIRLQQVEQERAEILRAFPHLKR
jgi:hypothetical protein